MTPSLNDIQHASIECHYAERRDYLNVMLKCQNVECGKAECRYADCRGAFQNS